MSITQINIWCCAECLYQVVSVELDVGAYSDPVVCLQGESWGHRMINGKERDVCPSCLKKLKEEGTQDTGRWLCGGCGASCHPGTEWCMRCMRPRKEQG